MSGPVSSPARPELVAEAAPSWRRLEQLAMDRLGSAQEARRLVEEVSRSRLAGLFGDSDIPVSGPDLDRFTELLERRAAGEPLQHVLGHWGFRRLELLVDRRALVPRPETEIVVEYALEELARVRSEHPAPKGERHRLLDLGTGSGAIAMAIVDEAPDVEVLAIDRSPEALALATANRARLAPSAAQRLSLCAGDWYAGIDPKWRHSVAVIVSNPPYLAVAELDGLDPVVADYDPHESLIAGPTGLEALEAIVVGAPDWLLAGGSLVTELAPHQGDPVSRLAHQAGASTALIRPDLAGRDRVLIARW